jgi:hypothetical protein
MTALRSAPIFAAYDTSRALLAALDDAGYTVRGITLYEGRLTIHLGCGAAQAAITALGLTVEMTKDFPAPFGRFSVADCTYGEGEGTVPVCILGDYNPQPEAEPH